MWSSPSIDDYDEALRIVQREREKDHTKTGPPPPAQLTESRYVEAWNYSEKQILESSEWWLQDMYTCRRWRVWVENDEFERMRDKPEKERRRDPDIPASELQHVRDTHPRWAQVPDAALRYLMRKKG